LREGDWVDINKDKNSIFSIGLDNDNILKWNIAFSGPSDTLLEVRSSYLSPQGGYYQAQLLFPDDFPNNPPKMKFLTQMWHPNISKEGNVCISILHASGEDQLNQ
jgi:ubiquitin-conjugating enzyme E2 G1